MEEYPTEQSTDHARAKYLRPRWPRDGLSYAILVDTEIWKMKI